MKEFKTMTELDILRAANETILTRWARESIKAERSPNNGIAEFKAHRYWEMLEEMHPEIVRLESAEKEKVTEK